MKTALVMRQGYARDQIERFLTSIGWQVAAYECFRSILAEERPAEPDVIIAELRVEDRLAWKYCNLLRSADISTLSAVPLLMYSFLYDNEYGLTVTRAMGGDGYIQLSEDHQTLVRRAVELVAKGERCKSTSTALFIEDDPVLLHMMVKKFASNQWVVDTAQTVEEGLKKIAGTRYDLLIIDFHLPDGKGDQLLEKVVSLYPGATIIMITADARTDLAVNWLDMGASAYLLKPFSPQYLFEIGNRCLREKMWSIIELQLDEKSRLLREREALVADFENTMGDVIWKRGTDLEYIYISPSVEKVTGFLPGQVRKLAVEEEMTAESAVRFRRLVMEAFAQASTGQAAGSQWRASLEMYHRSGGTVSVEVSFCVKSHGIGQPSMLLGMTRDISRERENEEQLVSLYSAISQADDVILVTDSRGYLQYANESFVRVTGYDPREFIGKEENILTACVEGGDGYGSFLSAVASGRSWSGEITSRRKDGTSYQERVKIIPLRNRQQEVSRFVAIKHDLTHELELVNEKIEIEERYLQAQKLEALGILAMGILHDFNNILTPIVGYANLIKLKYQSDELIQDHIDQIILAGDRARDLVKQVLLFSRGSNKRQDPIYLHLMLKECVKMVRAFLPPKISISCAIDESCPMVLIDSTKFSQLFMNLVTNSFQAMENSGGALAIELGHKKVNGAGQVELRVSDSGPGIPDEMVAHVFTPFVTTKEAGKGTGLGLSVCKSVIEEAGGKIQIEYSSRRKGTSILACFPAHTSGAEKEQIDKAVPTRFDGRGKKVLLVDDDRIVLDYLNAALSRLNFVVAPFDDSREALDNFSANSDMFSLVVTDIEMPNIDGIELIDSLRRIRGDLPIVVCTGNQRPELDMSLEEFENTVVIKKPATLGEMSAALKELVCHVQGHELTV